ncbi:MAG: hypothetical protein R2820_15270 [Cyclobacteriaceae bacterium]
MNRLTLSILGMFCLILVSTSCKDEDDGNPADLIVGSWRFVSYVASECSDPDDNENENCTSGCEVVVFTKDMVTFEGEPPESYSIAGNKITFGTGSGADTYEFSVTETTLTVIEQDPGECKEVTTLTRV